MQEKCPGQAIGVRRGAHELEVHRVRASPLAAPREAVGRHDVDQPLRRAVTALTHRPVLSVQVDGKTPTVVRRAVASPDRPVGVTPVVIDVGRAVVEAEVADRLDFTERAFDEVLDLVVHQHPSAGRCVGPLHVRTSVGRPPGAPASVGCVSHRSSASACVPVGCGSRTTRPPRDRTT